MKVFKLVGRNISLSGYGHKLLPENGNSSFDLLPNRGKVNMNFIDQLWKSIADFNFYKSLQNQSFRKTFLYIAKLTIIFGVISLIRPVLFFDRGVDLAGEYFRENIPYFVFKDGKLDVQGDQPFIWEEQETNLIVAMDTSGQIGPEILNGYNEGFFITKDYAIYKRNGIEKREFDFSQLTGVTFTKDDVNEWIPYTKWVNVLIVFFGLFGFAAGKLWSALLMAIFGMIICSGKNRFYDLYTISLYALTLPTVIKAGLVLFGVLVPGFILVYYGLAALYMWKAIDSIRNNKAFTA